MNEILKHFEETIDRSLMVVYEENATETLREGIFIM
jgi:hypothetical protein